MNQPTGEGDEDTTEGTLKALAIMLEVLPDGVYCKIFYPHGKPKVPAAE